MKEKKDYIPALKYGFLTPFFDLFLGLLTPERKFKGALISEAEIKPGQKILDFGCGTATLTIMAKTSCSEADVAGIDIDEKIIEIAEKKVEKSGLSIEIVHYQGGKLPFEDGTFDKVISSLVFHHLTTIQKNTVLNELYRILKAEGSLLIGDFGKPKNFLMAFLSNLLRLLEPIDDNIRGKLPKMIRQAGFQEAVETRYFNTVFGTISIYKAIKQL